ncbi:hypothetical protein P154DRAFT_553372 [Amniculicola lignicola CBS 123094]|uniref:Heterokaryon incompatibility domain-containing protein n=1 Tax=Amniculicola lignicola CBS 123094 TaxID=1392246 RepID=A0A6A5WW87_9PLEO|nr:hypothetical protein P154DRAFT_553372 [Amniculicola lignicola CBS 123094]
MFMAAPNYPSFVYQGQAGFVELEDEDMDSQHLQAHVVDPRTANALLKREGDRLDWPSSSMAIPHSPIEAERLLQDLTRVAPTVAKDFLPKDTVQDQLVLRLINDVDFVGEEESYVALSYCWKKVNRDMPRRVVSPVGDLPFGWIRTVEQFPLPVGRGMFGAAVREMEEGEGLWFDQVCINQDDEAEKSTSLGAIDLIYRNARTVVVALDDISVDEHEEIFLQQYVEQYTVADSNTHHPNQGLSPPFMQANPSLRSFLERILSSVWFERAWCAHEMRMGQSHVFLVPCLTEEGEDEPWSVFRFTGDFFLHLLRLAREVMPLFSGYQARICSLLPFFSRQCMVNKHDSVLAHSSPSSQHAPSGLAMLSETTSFISRIAEIFSMKAGGNLRLPEYLRRLDANRDRTAIALNTSGLPLALAPATPLQRPNIEDECLRQLLLVGIAARDPVALCTTGTPLQLHDGSISWISRPTHLDVMSSPGTPLPRFDRRSITNLHQSSDGQAEYIQLDLIFLELPHRAQPNPSFPNHLQRAKLFIDLCIQYAIPSLQVWTSWQTPPNHHPHPRAAGLKNIFIQTLACSFECGPSWLSHISSGFRNSPNEHAQLTPQLIDLFFHPQFMAEHYISTPEGHLAFTLLLNFVSTLITRGIPWASGASEQVCGPMVISPPNPVANSPQLQLQQQQQQYIPHPHPQPKAIIFAPFQHSNTLLIAVPDAVKARTYDRLARGWILTPRNPYTGSPNQAVCWTLQSKSVVFGDAGFAEELSAGVSGSQRYHRVFGPGR